MLETQKYLKQILCLEDSYRALEQLKTREVELTQEWAVAQKEVAHAKHYVSRVSGRIIRAEEAIERFKRDFSLVDA